MISIVVAIYFFNQAKVKEAEASLYGDIVYEVEQADLEEAKPAMTEEELEEIMTSHRQYAEESDVEMTEVIEETEGAVDDALETEATIEESNAADDTSVFSSDVIDFVGLQALNPDVYAWVSVPGTSIEYPILQHETDNAYYLNYNIDGSYGYPGCIYTENLNSKDFTDPNTVIYGHNMKNGTMFAGLHNFKDKYFFEAYDTVIIYTPEKVLEYEIFAAYIYDNRHLMYSFNFFDQAVFETYLEDVFAIRDMSANINQDITVTSSDCIITLATCVGDMPDNRLLVQAVLRN